MALHADSDIQKWGWNWDHDHSLKLYWFAYYDIVSTGCLISHCSLNNYLARILNKLMSPAAINIIMGRHAAITCNCKYAKSRTAYRRSYFQCKNGQSLMDWSVWPDVVDQRVTCGMTRWAFKTAVRFLGVAILLLGFTAPGSTEARSTASERSAHKGTWRSIT